MATKTISLELDAYEKLKRMKRGRESFSEVVRRARFDEAKGTGAVVLEEMAAAYGQGKGAGRKQLKHWQRMESEDRDSPRISPDPWEK